MREIPILFSTPMVQAILAGRKTMTRRIINESFNGCLTNGGPHPCPNDPVVFHPGEKFEFDGEQITVDYPQVRALFHCSTLDSEAKCPYGKKGDLLWVRETWCDYDAGYIPELKGPAPMFIYKADLTLEIAETVANETLQEMGGVASDICTGDCTTFAKKMVDALKAFNIEAEIVDALSEEMKSEISGYTTIEPEYTDGISHCYVKVDGYFFDAFNPEGVEKETRLDYLKNCK
jgi:hypothetical protein